MEGKAIELRNLLDKILSDAVRLGATAAEAVIGMGNGFTVDVRLGEVETIERHCDRSLTVHVYYGQKSGLASTSDFRQDTIRLITEKACYIAQQSEADPYAGLADASLMAHTYPDLDLDHPWELTTADAITLAKEVEASGLNYDQRIINSEGASVSTGQSSVIYGNTHEFRGFYSSTLHSVACNLITEYKGNMQRDGDFSIVRDAKKFNLTSLGISAARKTVQRLNPQHLKTQSIPVIFEAQMARDLIGDFIGAISGNNLYKRTSFLVDSLQQKIFPEHVTIQELPHLPQGLASAPFDAEGVRTLDRMMVKDGILCSYVLDSYAARRLNLTTTANAGGIHNLIVSSRNTCTFDQLIKTMGKGLLLTELLGQGVNLTTGDYSRGAFGFWVENGKIQYPVMGITVAGNLRDLFSHIIAVADDVDCRGAIRTGSILIDDIMVAGKAVTRSKSRRKFFAASPLVRQREHTKNRHKPANFY